jgi:zinc-ribbon domain
MTEGKVRKGRRQALKEHGRRSEDNARAERSLGRVVSIGLPVTCVAVAVLASVAGSVGPALLVLASGALLGAIALVWASIRTLSGDAPLSVGLELAATRQVVGDDLAEQKRRILRALKDVEGERALGRIDDADYEELVARYRDEAKTVMRELDRQVAPMREEAERKATQYLARHGFRSAETLADNPEPKGETRVDRLACPKCGASNEDDASFCKACGGAMTRTEAK